jgi:hypothetical protein
MGYFMAVRPIRQTRMGRGMGKQFFPQGVSRRRESLHKKRHSNDSFDLGAARTRLRDIRKSEVCKASL